MSKAAAENYISLLANEPGKFSHCYKQDQVMLMNVYGHVKPIINLIMSEKIKANSIILPPHNLIETKMNKCLTIQYGKINISTIGFDHRFNTWNTGNFYDINTKKMDSFINADQNNHGTELVDFCGDII